MAGQPENDELEFVGAERKQLVAELLQHFDEVAETRTPHWVSFEAPTGWGKSRIAHELYRCLAEQRQDDGPFWPRSIIDAIHEDERESLTVDGRRKRVYPEVIGQEDDGQVAAESTPAWFWWGFSCDNPHGNITQALAFSVRQFWYAKVGLEARWRRKAPLTKRAKRAIKAGAAGLGDAGVGDVIDAVTTVANASIPGLGSLLYIAGQSFDWLRKRANEDQALAAMARDTASRGVDLVKEIAPEVAQVARDIVPIVIFVEDLHRADKSLVELLVDLLNENDTAVLVVTTGWPGVVEERARPSHELAERVPSERRTHHSTLPDSENKLGAFAEAHVRGIADHLLPDAPPEVVDALVLGYSNPLALQLACGSKQLERALDSGHDPVGVVEGLPREVADLYEDEWKELPESTRMTCMLAVWTTLAGLHPDGHGDRDWDGELVAAAIAAVPALSKEALRADSSLPDPAAQYQWVRIVSEWLRRFHEPLQFDVVLDEARHEFRVAKGDLSEFFEAIVALTDLDSQDDDRALHQARFVLALEAAGYVDRLESQFAGVAAHRAKKKGSDGVELAHREVETGPQWRQAAEVLCAYLGNQPDSASAVELVSLVDKIVEGSSTEHAQEDFGVRALRAAALGKLGRSSKAVTALEDLLADQVGIFGDRAPETLPNTRRTGAVARRRRARGRGRCHVRGRRRRPDRALGRERSDDAGYPFRAGVLARADRSRGRGADDPRGRSGSMGMRGRSGCPPGAVHQEHQGIRAHPDGTARRGSRTVRAGARGPDP